MRRNRQLPPLIRRPQPEPEPPPSGLVVWQQRLKSFYLRYRSLFLVSAGILIALAAMLIYSVVKPPPYIPDQRDIDTAVEQALESAKPKPSYASQAYEIIRPSLVRVQTLISEDEEKPEGALGTGVVVTDRGIILTSLHIVKDALVIQVVFADGTESAAAIIAAEPEKDIAVLQAALIPDDLQPATLTSSATLRIGDEIVAVGNPFGMENSVSAGVISGLGRSFKSQETGEVITDLIQFDAAVNRGNSGGPLLNRNGQVVGIVTALLNPTDLNVFIGIGFAVPIEAASGAAGSPPY